MEDEKKKTSNEICRKCKYSFLCCIGKGTKRQMVACQYILITGRSRMCEIGCCDKFESKESDGKRKKGRSWRIKGLDNRI